MFGFLKKASVDKAQERFDQIREIFTISMAKRIEAAKLLSDYGGGPPPVDDRHLVELLNRAAFGIGDKPETHTKDMARDLTRAIIIEDANALNESRNRLAAYLSYSYQLSDLLQREASNTWKIILEKESWRTAIFGWYSGGGKIRIRSELQKTF